MIIHDVLIKKGNVRHFGSKYPQSVLSFIRICFYVLIVLLLNRPVKKMGQICIKTICILKVVEALISSYHILISW